MIMITRLHEAGRGEMGEVGVYGVGLIEGDFLREYAK